MPPRKKLSTTQRKDVNSNVHTNADIAKMLSEQAILLRTRVSKLPPKQRMPQARKAESLRQTSREYLADARREKKTGTHKVFRNGARRKDLEHND